MVDRSYLDWPFFDAPHRALHDEIEAFCQALEVDHGDTDAACRDLVRQLGEAGVLQHSAILTASWMCVRCA